MKFDVLHNFISPVTGRILADFNYVLVGNSLGIATPSPILIDIRLDLINLRKKYNTLVDADFIVGHPNDQIPNAQVLSGLDNGYMFNTGGIVSTTATIPIGTLPDLTYTYLWTGNIFNRPIEVATIIINNLPDLTTKFIWRGVAGRPVEVNDLTVVEDDLGNAIAEIASIASLLSSLASAVSALQSIVAGLEAGLASVGGWVGIALLQTQVLGLIVAIAATNARIDALRLNNISADADVSLYNFKIINLADPINPQDAATKHYVDSAIGGGAAPVNATYIIQTASAPLINAQILASLTTGLVKNTTTTGVLSIGVPGTDYYSPGHPTTLIDDFTPNVNPLLAYGNLGVGTNVLFSLVLNSAINTVNVAVGPQALYSFTTGSGNTSLGYLSLFGLVTGTSNTAVGSIAGYALTSGDNNVFCGSGTAFSMTTGTGNSFFGYEAGEANNNLTDCLFLGRNADCTTNGLTNAIAIGTNAKVSASNSMVLGFGVNVGIGTSTPAYTLDVQGNINGTWVGNIIDLAHGGTNASLTASNGGIVYSTASALAILAGTATAHQVLLSGSSTTPSWSTATYPVTTTINQLLYSSSTNTIAGLATANSGVLITNSSGVPSISSTLPLISGGANAALTAVNGGVVYSTASALAVSTAPAVTNEILMGQVGSAPIWSAATYPSNVLPGQLLYGSGLFAISGLTTAANGVLVTDGSDIPSISSTLPTAVQANITQVGTITSGTWTGTNIALSHGGTNATLTASNGGIVYSTASAMAILAGTATANQILLSGSSAAPAWSTVTHPATTTINQILYSSATNTIAGLATANSGVLITNSSGVPSVSSTLPLISGGANAALTASNGGIVYSTASALSVLAGTATANQMLLSGASAAPAWSTVTHPATTTINQLLYSSSANVIAGLATANSSVLLTNGSGVPAWQTLTSSAVTSITGTANQITASAASGAVTLSLPTGVVITTSVTAGNLELITNTLQSTNTNGNILVNPNGNGNVTMLTGGGTGNLGVGTTTPTQALAVINGGVQNISNEQSAIRVISALNNVKIELQNTAASGKLYELRSSNTGNFDITDRTGSGTRFIIDTNGNVGLGITPSFKCDVGGTTRTQKLIGNANAPSVVLGGAGVVGTGAGFIITGTEVAGTFVLTTGTGVLTTGIIATFTLTSAMPANIVSIFTPAATTISTGIFTNGVTTTVFRLNVGGALGLTASSSYAWNYIIAGN
jgi:hypothetical protein